MRELIWIKPVAKMGRPRVETLDGGLAPRGAQACEQLVVMPARVKAGKHLQARPAALRPSSSAG